MKKWLESRDAKCGTARASARPQVPGFRPRESLDAVRAQRHADARMSDARPWQPGTDAVTAIPIDRARMHLRQNRPRTLFVGRVDAGREPVFGVVHQRN